MRDRVFVNIRVLHLSGIFFFYLMTHSCMDINIHAQDRTIVFDDFEHGAPFENDWFIFFGPNALGAIKADSINLRMEGSGNYALHSRWNSNDLKGYVGGVGRTNKMSLSGMSNFTFWINPKKGADYVLEINLQDDDNRDGEISIEDDDEFQYKLIVSSIGPGAITGAGWQKVTIPLTDFYDDNSYLRGGNGILDAFEATNGGNGQLINVVFAIINNTEDEIEFLTDDLEFNDETAIASDEYDSKILFVGNSYTFYNNMPQLFFKLAEAGGKQVLVDQSAFAGYWLNNHLTNSHTLKKIYKKDWDYVIIQEQSQVPTIKHWRTNSMYPSIQTLNSLIQNQGAETVLFMTWGRKFGGEQFLNDFASADFDDYYQMQDTLALTYLRLAEYLAAKLAPVGLAWENALIINPDLNLWDEDQSHPTYEGSYLTASVFYAILFDETPVGLDFSGNLDKDMAWFLQSMASTVLVKYSSQLSVTE